MISRLSTDQQDQITQLKQQTFTTKRICSPSLEEVLYDLFPVLDHGFVRVIDYMGCDESIVQAARVSYGKGTKKVSEDKGLIRYLLRHWHTTPFEMCEIKLHVKLPIFVARQWIRHRTANVNEYSARYSILDNEFYLPAKEHLATQAANNRQGRSEAVSPEMAQRILDLLKEDATRCYDHYEYLLNEDNQHDHPGIARELARMNLPVSYYTQWYWKTDLHNLLHFLHLRADAHAQYEIRVYAQVILEEIVKRWVPVVYEAFLDYRCGGMVLSAQSLDLIKRWLQGEKPSFEKSGMSKREWEEFHGAFGGG